MKKETRHNKRVIIIFAKSNKSKSSQCLWIRDTTFNKYKENKTVILGDYTNIISKKLTTNTKYGYRGSDIDSKWFTLFLNTYV